MTQKFTLALACLSVLLGCLPTLSWGAAGQRNVRLPTHVKPLNYDVSLTPFIEPGNFTVSGYVSILIKVLEPARNVTLHMKDIHLEQVSVEKVDGTKCDLSQLEVVAALDFLIIHLKEPLKANCIHILNIKFYSELNDGLHGFYRSQYEDENRFKKILATTHFEPTHARSAFPCFDEPNMKARFKIRIGRTKEMHTISNMPKSPLQSSALADVPGYIYDQFMESVPMSTYLVAFVVSDFDFKADALRHSNVTFRVWSRRNALDQTDYARSIGARILQYFEHYFAVDFPLPKLDMIAIPDFSAGAMENWGLITYRESALLYKSGVSPRSAKQRIALVVSHELAHQWFGNLVTPKWWTDLWLNEGFASYVEYLGVQAVEPQMKIMEQFITSEVQNVMKLDALASSHPVSVEVHDPDEIAEIFDRISYAKGATIIRMMDYFLTEDTFRRGLSTYLKELQFKNADQDDLWQYLTEQAHLDAKLPTSMNVKTIMDTWTLQTGFPVLEVTRDYKRNSANISQERFFLNRDMYKGPNHKWWIPVTFGSSESTKKSTKVHWLAPNEDWKEVSHLPGKSEPVIFNIRQTGYYRVNYDIRNWNMLIDTLGKGPWNILTENRAQIIDDSFNLARAGYLDYWVPLKLISYLRYEKSLVPWRSATSSFRYLKSMFQRTPAYGEFQRFMKRMAKPVYRQYGLRNMIHNGYEDSLLRNEIINWACSIEVEECCDNVKSLFNIYLRSGDQRGTGENMVQTEEDDDEEDYEEEAGGEAIAEIDLSDEIDINPDLRKSVMCNALALGGEVEWNHVWEKYRESNVASQKQGYLRILSCSHEIWILNKYLNMSVDSKSGIRKQDAPLVIVNVARNIHGRDLAFNFVRTHWSHLKTYLGGRFERILGSVLDGRNTRLELDELRAFVRDHEGEFGAGKRTVEQALEAAEVNVNWMETHYFYIADWIAHENSRQDFSST